MASGEAFAKVELRFLTHPKVIGIGAEAKGVWLSGLLYSKVQRTDGFVPVEALGMMCDTHAGSEPVAVLVERGLWDEVEGRDRAGNAIAIGYQIHDYGDHQDDRKREQISEARAAAGRVGGIRSGESRRVASGSVKQTEAIASSNEATDVDVDVDNPPPPQGVVSVKPAARLLSVVEAWNANRGELPSCRKVPSGKQDQRALGVALDDVEGDLALLGAAFAAAAADSHYRDQRYGIVTVCRHVGGRWRGVAEAKLSKIAQANGNGHHPPSISAEDREALLAHRDAYRPNT